MAYRKLLVNFGIIHEDSVFYASDMDIRPVLELSKFSISFANNLVRNASLVSMIHEPKLDITPQNTQDDGGGKSLMISKEHIMFKEIKNFSPVPARVF